MPHQRGMASPVAGSEVRSNKQRLLLQTCYNKVERLDMRNAASKSPLRSNHGSLAASSLAPLDSTALVSASCFERPPVTRRTRVGGNQCRQMPRRLRRSNLSFASLRSSPQSARNRKLGDHSEYSELVGSGRVRYVRISRRSSAAFALSATSYEFLLPCPKLPISWSPRLRSQA